MIIYMHAQRGFSPLLLIAGVTILLVLGGTGFFFFQQNNTQPVETATQTQTQAQTQTETKAVKDLNDFSFEISDKKLLFSGGYADPSVIKLNDTYLLYINKFGNDGSANLIYTSKDGLDWKETGKKVPGGPTKRAYIDGEKIRLYYPTNDPINPSDPPSEILSAISTDGLNFTQEDGVRMKPISGYTIEGPTIIKLPDGTYRMYFSEYKTASKQERKDAKIFGASSKDGINFTRDAKSTIESNMSVEKSPANWPQVLRPFVLKRPSGGYIMFYNSHSKIFAAYSDDGYSFKKLGGIGVKGADIDAIFQSDGRLRIYFGDFSEQTSGVIYTGILKEVKERTTSSEVSDAPDGNMQPAPMGGSKPPPPPSCAGKSATDPDLSQECQMWFKIQ